VCRRAERLAVSLARVEKIGDEPMKYPNAPSDESPGQLAGGICFPDGGRSMGTAKNSGRGQAKDSGQDAAKDLERLNFFLGDELAAVETYKLALDNLGAGTHARTNLETCLRSHQQRVSLLRAAIDQLGGEAAHGPGAWEALVQLVEGGVVDDRAALAALEAGEDHTLDHYHADLSSLDPRWRQMVQFELVPKQLQSHHAIHELRKTLH
jgi:hypothetical protein